MNPPITPRNGLEWLASDLLVRTKRAGESLRAQLGSLEPGLLEHLDGKESLFAYWRRYKEQEQALADAQSRLKGIQTALAAEHESRLRALIAKLRDLETAGLVKIDYAHRVKRGEIKKALRGLGVRSGDVLFVHSQLSGLGYVEVGIPGIIAELRSAVGRKGTLAMPVFSQNYPGMIEGPYSKEKSLSTAGRITEAFRKMPGVRRSDNPCHSIAAIGPLADALTAPHGNHDMFDRKGPFGRLHDLDAWIVMLGCSLGANTMLHAVEAWALPYLPPMFLHADDGHGRIKRVLCRQFPGGHREWYGKREQGKIQKRLFEHGVLRRYEIGRGTVYAMRTQRLVQACLGILKKEPDVFLCEETKCRDCPSWRAMLVGWRVPDAV